MILDIDIGNTNTKWRVIDQSRISLRGSQTTESLINGQDLDLSLVDRLTRARLCSVADKSIITALSSFTFTFMPPSDDGCTVTCAALRSRLATASRPLRAAYARLCT